MLTQTSGPELGVKLRVRYEQFRNFLSDSACRHVVTDREMAENFRLRENPRVDLLYACKTNPISRRCYFIAI